MYKTQFNQRKALRFRQFTRKGYALFACLGRVVTIGVLSVATLRAAAVTTPDTLSVVGALATNTADDDSPDKEATLDGVEVTGSRAPLALGQAANAGPMCHCKSGSFGTDPISLLFLQPFPSHSPVFEDGLSPAAPSLCALPLPFIEFALWAV